MSSPRNTNLPRRQLSKPLTSPNLGSTHSTSHGSYSPVTTLHGDVNVAELPRHRQEPATVEVTLKHASRKALWERFRGKSRASIPGVIKSLEAIVTCSCEFALSRTSRTSDRSRVGLNLFLIFIPIAWVAHFEIHHWKNGPIVVFACTYVHVGMTHP